tara:strand:+ start:511 stop:717 length:207 start_codon:yes stop_codon:yes gene_type:complete
MKELKTALRLLEFSISDLIKQKSDVNEDNYYLAYAKVAKLKIKKGDDAIVYSDTLHWLYESVKTENYK